MKRILSLLIASVLFLCLPAAASDTFFEPVFLNELGIAPEVFLESEETRAFFSVTMCMDVIASPLTLTQEEISEALSEQLSYVGRIDLGDGDVGTFLYLHLKENDWLFNYFVFGDTGYVLYTRYEEVYPDEAVLAGFAENGEVFRDVEINSFDAIILAAQAVVDAFEQ